MSPKEYQRRLKTILSKATLQNIAYQEIKEKEVELRKVKEEELESGLRPDGKIIGKYKSQAYANRKRLMNPKANGNVDLIYSRAFITSFKLLKPNGNRYRFTATDSKTNSLLKKYGRDNLGLNQRSFDSFLKTKIASGYFKALKQYAKIR